MHPTTFLPLLSLLTSLPITLAGNATVHNTCAFPVYLFSVNPSTASPIPSHLINGTLPYTEAFQATPGVSLKISKSPNDSALYDGSPLTQFQYTLDGATVWYDLADTGGDIFAGKSVVLKPSDEGCVAVDWAQGKGMSSVNSCGSGGDLVLTLC